MTILGKVFLIASGLLSLVPLVLIWEAYRRHRLDRKRLIDYFHWSFVAIFGALTLACAVLLFALLSKDYSFLYAVDNSSADMTWLYRMSAFWSGKEGSLLLWLWLLSAMTATIAWAKKRETNPLHQYALAIMGVVQTFFLAVLIFGADPFLPSPAGTIAGNGINPLLMHWAMVIHPPTLFVGYAGATIPFAYALAALFLNDASDAWIKHVQKWNLFGWLLLTAGIFFGALWAYVVLGWGGYWGWDPVENASMLPWFTGTALIHSFTAYRHRKSYKVWTLSLAVLTFFLVILATFITRTGVIKSVHAYEADTLMTVLFGGAMIVTLAVGFGLIISKRKLFESEAYFESFFSKDFTYYLNNFLMLVFMGIVAGGTAGPSLAGALSPFFAMIPGMSAWLVRVSNMSVSTDFYNRLAYPLGIVYVLVVTICPLLLWRKTDAGKFEARLILPGVVTALAAAPIFLYWQSLRKMMRQMNGPQPLPILGYLGMLVAIFAISSGFDLFIRWGRHFAKTHDTNFVGGLWLFFAKSRSKAGGFLTHLGVALLLLGLVGSSMFVGQIKKSVKPEPSSVIQFAGFTLKYEDYFTATSSSADVYRVRFGLYDSKKKYLGTVSPQITYYQTQKQETRQVDIRRHLFYDVFVIFEGTDNNNLISMRVFVNPLINFVWIGSFIMMLGTSICAWPSSGGSGRALPSDKRPAREKAYA